MPYTPTTIPFNWNPNAAQQQQPTAPVLPSPNYNQVKDWYRSPDSIDPPLMPIYDQLRKGGVNLIVDAGVNMKLNSGYKNTDFPGANLYGSYQKKDKKFILSSDRSQDWWHNVPHEYAHYVTQTQTPTLMSDLPKMFKDEEHMADSYANYYNDPGRYTKEHPTETAWFQKNFVNRTIPAPTPAPRTLSVLQTPPPKKQPVASSRSLSFKKTP